MSVSVWVWVRVQPGGREGGGRSHVKTCSRRTGRGVCRSGVGVCVWVGVGVGVGVGLSPSMELRGEEKSNGLSGCW